MELFARSKGYPWTLLLYLERRDVDRLQPRNQSWQVRSAIAISSMSKDEVPDDHALSSWHQRQAASRTTYGVTEAMLIPRRCAHLAAGAQICIVNSRAASILKNHLIFGLIPLAIGCRQDRSTVDGTLETCHHLETCRLRR